MRLDSKEVGGSGHACFSYITCARQRNDRSRLNDTGASAILWAAVAANVKCRTLRIFDEDRLRQIFLWQFRDLLWGLAPFQAVVVGKGMRRAKPISQGAMRRRLIIERRVAGRRQS